MTSHDPSATTAGVGGRRGAPLAPPIIAYALLTVGALVLPTVLAGSGMWSSADAFVDVYRQHADAVRLQSLLTITAAVPLAVFSAIVCDRIGALGLTVPGRFIALVGGTVAAALLATSGLMTLELLGAQGDSATLEVGRRFATAVGGTGFALFSGLLIAGIAVTGLMGRLLPRSVALAGLALAVVAELAVLTVVTDAANPLLPVTRFGGVVWLAVVVLTLRRR